MSHTRDAAVAAPASTVRPVRSAAALSALVLLWQFVTAGQMLSGAKVLSAHGAGAIALHVATGLLTLATVLYGRRTQTWWPAALAATTFVLTFVQAALGSSGNIAAHVPVALAVSAGTVWLTAWAFRSAGS